MLNNKGLENIRNYSKDQLRKGISTLQALRRVPRIGGHLVLSLLGQRLNARYSAALKQERVHCGAHVQALPHRHFSDTQLVRVIG